MALQDFGHECDRFRARGMVCPFSRFEEDEEDDPDEDEESDAAERRIPLALPGRRERDADIEQRQAPLMFPHADPEFRKRLEQMAAFKNLGDFPFLPRLPQMTPDVPGRFRLTGRGHEAVMAGLAAIVIMQTIRALRSSGFGLTPRLVGISEKRAGSQLKGVTRLSPGEGRPLGGGRGGFHMRADKFRRLMRPPRLGSGLVSGFDSFSETGFP